MPACSVSVSRLYADHSLTLRALILQGHHLSTVCPRSWTAHRDGGDAHLQERYRVPNNVECCCSNLRPRRPYALSSSLTARFSMGIPRPRSAKRVTRPSGRSTRRSMSVDSFCLPSAR